MEVGGYDRGKQINNVVDWDRVWTKRKEREQRLRREELAKVRRMIDELDDALAAQATLTTDPEAEPASQWQKDQAAADAALREKL